MAETVKKSRIVSDDDLEETLMEEFNMRLKSCLSQDTLDDDDDDDKKKPKKEENYYENIETLKSNELFSVKSLSRTFIETEKGEQINEIKEINNDRGLSNGHNVSENIIYENVQNISKITNEYSEKLNGNTSREVHANVESRIEQVEIPKPSFTLFQAPSVDSEMKSVKDRMFLSSGDDTSTLLFTQTVTSPMLTPSEENVDFLKGFRRESSPNSSPKDSSQSEESSSKTNGQDLPKDVELIREFDNDFVEDIEKDDVPNAEKLNNQVQENIYENLEMNESSIYENLKTTNLSDCFNKNEGSLDESEQGSEGVVISQIEQHNKPNDFVDEDDVTEISDVCSLDKQVSDSDSSNMILDNNTKSEENFVNSDRFGVIKDYLDRAKDIEVDVKTGYNDSEVMEYIAMTEEPKNRFKKDRIESEDDEKKIKMIDGIVKNYIATKSDVNSINREKDTETVPPKIVQNLTNQFMKSEDERDDGYVMMKNKQHDINQLKSVDITRQINKFEQKDDEICDKSSFSKFDALQKKNVIHNIRSSDSTKVQEKFNGNDSTNCKCCGKQVFQMEQIKAEKAIWHQKCFRCRECGKQLNVDTYESHEGTLYCKPHFKALFAPKAVDDNEEPTSDKPDLGLEELQSLNVKERFQVFEQHQANENTMEKTQVNVKRSASILSKLAKFQAKGMDIGVSDNALNGIPIEESSSEEEVEEDMSGEEDPDLVRAKRVQKEKPFHFTGMSDVKSKWEHGDSNSKDERREERKQEIQSIRNKLFMGKQGKMKEAYQEAVMKSESSVNLKKEEIKICDTKMIKERFEKGEIVQEIIKDPKDEEEQEIYESEISKKSRSLFLQLDANASKPPQISPVTPPKLEMKKAREAYIQKSASQDTVKSSEQIDDVTVQTADIQQRFKFFETYKEPEKKRKTFRITPPREGQVKGGTPEKELYHDPEVVRADEIIEDSVIAKETHTATKMLNKFRQMEENLSKEPTPQGPKPLKRFTPPPEPTREEESSSEEGSETEEEIEQDECAKVPDDDLIEAQKAARAKQLRAKFEKWEAQEIKREQNNSSINIMEEYGEEQSQIESTKLLRARFESMKENHSEISKQPRVKVNRFVELSSNIMENCEACEKRVYPLEKISVHGRIYHKSCFKCKECNTILRMDSYTFNQGRLYCTPHFKRLFITKGNYDSAFGLDGHKEKWNPVIA